MASVMMRNSKQGSDGIMYCAACKETNQWNGAYIGNFKPLQPSKLATEDKQLSSKLWDTYEQMIVDFKSAQ
jgi:hypothetical protein